MILKGNTGEFILEDGTSYGEYLEGYFEGDAYDGDPVKFEFKDGKTIENQTICRDFVITLGPNCKQETVTLREIHTVLKRPLCMQIAMLNKGVPLALTRQTMEITGPYPRKWFQLKIKCLETAE